MIILGVADGAAGAAAVVADDQVVAAVDRTDLPGPPSPGLPWEAMDLALRSAGYDRRDVDVVALAGTQHPMLLLRRHPGLRGLVRSPFSPWVETYVTWQAVLRWTGLGAAAGDEAAEWFGDQLGASGFAPSRVLTVDTHRALAEAAYRLQPHDEALVVTLHPMGDGAVLAVHLGRAGQLDRMHVQPGFASLLSHLRRVFATLDLPLERGMRRLGERAAHGRVDAVLADRLRDRLSADGPRLLRRDRPRPESPDAQIYRRLRALAPEDAAATVHANVVDAVTQVVGYHVETHAVRRLALAGSLADDPRLVAAIAELPGVEGVSVLPNPGVDALAVGAAAMHAGLAPHRVDVWWGPDVPADAVERAVDRAGLHPTAPGTASEVLAAGGAVVRVRGRSGPGALGLGNRCVLVRADDAAAVDRVRRALALPDDAAPCLLLPAESLDGFDAHEDALRSGALAVRPPPDVAARYPSAVGPDGRVWVQAVRSRPSRSLHRLLVGVREATGAGGLCAFAVARGDDAPHVAPGSVIGFWQRSGLEALQLGAHVFRAGA